MKKLFVILALFTLSLATQAQDKSKYEGLKKISPDRPRSNSTIIYLPDLDDMDFSDLDINVDLSGLESLSDLSALSSLAELERLEELEVLEELEALEILADDDFLEEIIEISIDASLRSLDALKEIEIKPRKVEQ